MAIDIYTRATCRYCAAAIKLLQKRHLDYKQIELTDNPDLARQIEQQTKQATTPQIFIDGQYVGGFDELVELDQEGKLTAS